jgi:hypothetical protein
MSQPTDLGVWARRQAARLEDLTFMADHGETHIGAAERIGMTVDALDRWCHRHDAKVWNRLVANQHKPGYLPAGTVAQPTRKQGTA